MNKEAGRKLLLDIVDVLVWFDVPFFLIQGTALGAYRDKGFTPTERDIDFGVFQEHLQHCALEILAELMVRGYDVEAFTAPFTKPRTLVVFGPGGAKADIVGLARWKDKRFTATPVRSWITKPYAIVHDAAMLETYEEVELFGRLFNVPSPIEKYLELEYGKDWRTPREDHESRTRVYDFLAKEGVPLSLFDQ